MSQPPKFEKQLIKYLLVATLVPTLLLLFTLYYYQASGYLISLISLSLFCLIVFCATTIYDKITFQLRTLSNLLEGMVHGDYSLRGRQTSGSADNALTQLVNQINGLADTLLAQRYAAKESQLLVSKVIQHIDVAILAIDEKQTVALVNPAAEKLLNVTEQSVLGKDLNHIGCQPLLNVQDQKLVSMEFAAKKGKFQVIKDQYREQGHQHQLFFITDVNQLLREQERQAWQNLIRVLSHEINNSLSPIASLAGTLKGFSQKIDNAAIADNFNQGLAVISERAESLGQFIQSYRQLTHLPAINLSQVALANLVSKLLALLAKEFSREIKVDIAPSIMVNADPIQLEQVLINLIKNAHEASKLPSDKITIKAEQTANKTVISIIDNGAGLSDSDNLFTPFYTTKAQGSGIGLVLSRQIIEAHGGTFYLTNRNETNGCIATIEL